MKQFLVNFIYGFVIVLVIAGLLLVAWRVGRSIFSFAENQRLERISQEQLTESREEVCRQEHGTEIMEYVKECTAALQVEENAYVISECEQVARRNLCSL